MGTGSSCETRAKIHGYIHAYATRKVSFCLRSGEELATQEQEQVTVASEKRPTLRHAPHSALIGWDTERRRSAHAVVWP
jgi:hypothetical protein